MTYLVNNILPNILSCFIHTYGVQKRINRFAFLQNKSSKVDLKSI
jgi:hypothetical protein